MGEIIGSGAGMPWLNFSGKLQLGYSCDYLISKPNNCRHGPHGCVTGFTIGNGFDDFCPKNVR